MVKSKLPHVYIIAGANGAGKTTFTNRFLPDFVGCKHFVSVDSIAAYLCHFRLNLRGRSRANKARGKEDLQEGDKLENP